MQESFRLSAEFFQARGKEQEQLHSRASAATRTGFDRQVFLRAVVEVSNFCRENCSYCGMRRDNETLHRFRASLDQLSDLILQHRPPSVRDINIQTGEVAWDLPGVTTPATSSGGVLSTATGLVFFCENSGSFLAVDASSGKVVWDFPTNQTWKASPMSYVFDNKQYVAIAVGTSIMAFGLQE